MKTFLGTKMVKAIAMTRAAYVVYRGWELPASENGEDKGYLVEYTDGGTPNDERHAGYISWSPEEQFHRGYREFQDLTFGMALEAIKIGKKVARAGWNGKNMWICQGEGRTIPISNVWSPQIRELAETTNAEVAVIQPYIILKTADDQVQMGWSPSQTDVLAEDWLIVI